MSIFTNEQAFILVLFVFQLLNHSHETLTLLGAGHSTFTVGGGAMAPLPPPRWLRPCFRESIAIPPVNTLLIETHVMEWWNRLADPVSLPITIFLQVFTIWVSSLVSLIRVLKGSQELCKRIYNNNYLQLAVTILYLYSYISRKCSHDTSYVACSVLHERTPSNWH